MAKFPWANILHNVVVNVIMYVFSNEEETLIKSFLDTNILRKIIIGLSQLGEIGYRPHLRMVAFAMRNSNSLLAQEIFNNDPLWSKFWLIMQARDEREWTFKQAEDKVRVDLNSLLNGTYEPTIPLLSQEVDSFSETPDEFNETTSALGDGLNEQVAEIGENEANILTEKLEAELKIESEEINSEKEEDEQQDDEVIIKDIEGEVQPNIFLSVETSLSYPVVEIGNNVETTL